MKKILITNLCAFACAAAPLAAQEEKPPRLSKPVVVEEESLTLLHYVPTTSQADQLAELAYNMWGRTFTTSDDARNMRRNIFQNVDSIVIYDEQQRAQRILRMLKELDGASRKKPEFSEPDTEVIKLEYATVDEARAALRPFTRRVSVRDKSGQIYSVNNVDFVETRSAVIVRDDKETIAAIRRVLKEIDTPRPQVMITCWVIRGSRQEEESEFELPEGLVGNLKKLVPMEHFSGLGMGIVNTSVEPREQIGMTINLRDRGAADLKMLSRAYDSVGHVLHVRQCRCQLALRSGRDGGRSEAPQSLTTQLAMRDGEYTVLGAMGSSPVFVVLRLTKRGKTN